MAMHDHHGMNPKNIEYGCAVEEAIYEREFVGICRDVDIAVVFSKPFLGLLELGTRIIEQDDAFVAIIAGSITSCASTDLKE